MAKTGAPQFRIRLDAEMKEDIEEDALIAGRSLNGEIEYRLRAYERYRSREERRKKIEERFARQEKETLDREMRYKQRQDRDSVYYYKELISIREKLLKELDKEKIGKEIHILAEYDLVKVKSVFDFYKKKFLDDYGFDYTNEEEFYKIQQKRFIY